MSLVYMATNAINGKRYVGVTNNTLEKRRRGHLQKSRNYGKEKNNSRFHSAIRKYGWENFDWEILAEFSSYEDALHGEIKFISLLKPEYNVLPGGIGGQTGIPANNRKSVICLEDGNIFPSISLAAKFYDSTPSEITNSCKARRQYNTANGKHFVFGSEEISKDKRSLMIKERDQEQVLARSWKSKDPEWVAVQMAKRKENATGTKPKLKSNKLGHKKLSDLGKKNINNWKKYSHLGPKVSSRPVICVNDGNIFESASAAARNYGSCKSAVIELCCGQKFRKTVNGRRFMYYIGPLKETA